MDTPVEIWGGRVIDAIWSRQSDEFVYKGCPVVLNDGKIWALSVARGTQEQRKREEFCNLIVEIN